MGSFITREESLSDHDAILNRCNNLEKANKKLHENLSEKDKVNKNIRNSLTQTKGVLDTTQSDFIDLEKELVKSQNRNKELQPTIDKLRDEVANTRDKLSTNNDDISAMRVSFLDYEKQVSEGRDQ